MVHVYHPLVAWFAVLIFLWSKHPAMTNYSLTTWCLPAHMVSENVMISHKPASAHRSVWVLTQVTNKILIEPRIKFRSQLENFLLLPKLSWTHQSTHTLWTSPTSHNLNILLTSSSCFYFVPPHERMSEILLMANPLYPSILCSVNPVTMINEVTLS